MGVISKNFATEGVHEREVRRLFPNNFVWEGEAPIYSKPLYLLAFTNRSGSNLLADYLRQTKKFHGFGEGLNWDEVQLGLTRRPCASFPDYIQWLAGNPASSSRFGIKASWEQIIMLYRARIPAMFSGVQILHSVRQDLVGQAISHWIAHQTNQWTSAHQKSDVVPKFALDRIEAILSDIIRAQGYIDLICQALNIPSHLIIYEKLMQDPAGEMRNLASAISLDLGTWAPGAPKIAQQRGDTNAEFHRLCREAWSRAILSR